MSSDSPTFGQKVRYQIDRFLSWSPLARILGLFLLSLALVAICAGLALLTVPPGAAEGEGFDFFEAMWWSLMRVIDTGTMAEDRGLLVRSVAVLSTLCGIMVVAILIGLVSSTVNDTFEDLRKGRSPVIDEDHTLILGFGEKVFAILRELREANRSRRSGASVVILSLSDKEEVEQALGERMGDMRNTRVIVRQGSPFSPPDLKKVGAGRARSIILLASDADPDDDALEHQADLGAIKTLLALRRIPGALERNHVVIELLDGARRSVVERLGGSGVEVVAMRETLGRMMVQTARQSGLAQVYKDLLSYEGSELYFHPFPELAGVAWGEVQARLKDAVALGVRHGAGEGAGKITLNPPDSMRLEEGDEVLVLAEDDDTFSLCETRLLPPPRAAKSRPPQPKTPERILICGFNRGVPDVLREFDQYVVPGSGALVMPGVSKDAIPWLADDGASLGLKNLRLGWAPGDPTDPDALKTVTQYRFGVAMMMASDGVDPQEADARTVITLLLLRDLFSAHPRPPRLISEILDPRTKELISLDDAGDVVVSSEITSMLLAQVSERRELNAVFADLFDADGNELYLKRAELFAPLGEALSWLEVQRAARGRNEVALGVFRAAGALEMNPPQSGTMTFSAGDRLVVLAEDDTEASTVVLQRESA